MSSLPDVPNEPRDVRDLKQRDDHERAAHAVTIEHAVDKEIESHQDCERYNRVDCEHLQRSLLGKHCNRERNHRHNVHVIGEHHRRCVAERYESKRTSTSLYGGPHV